MTEQVYVHMELHGPRERLLGFVEGVRVAAGEASVWYGGEDSYALDTVKDAVKEKFGVELHVVLPAALVPTVEAQLAAARVVKATVTWVRDIRHAELAFTFRCFSREVGEELRRVVETDLPAGVRLEDYKVEESKAADAEVVELYTPVHHYTLSGSGRYLGPVPAIFALARRLHDQDFIEPDKVHLFCA
jgi:hypothetical protein